MEYTTTFEDIFQGAPQRVCHEYKNNRLPEDVFHRVSMSIPVSSQAMNNPGFDWRRFVVVKIHNTLKRLRSQHKAKFLTLYESGFYSKTERGVDTTVFKFCFCYTVPE